MCDDLMITVCIRQYMLSISYTLKEESVLKIPYKQVYIYIYIYIYIDIIYTKNQEATYSFVHFCFSMCTFLTSIFCSKIFPRLILKYCPN